MHAPLALALALPLLALLTLTTALPLPPTHNLLTRHPTASPSTSSAASLSLPGTLSSLLRRLKSDLLLGAASGAEVPGRSGVGGMGIGKGGVMAETRS